MERNLNFKNLFLHNKICLLCSNQISIQSIFCPSCYKNLPFISNGCKVCSAPIQENKTSNCDSCVQYIHAKWFLDGVKSLFLYKNHGKELVIKMKKSNDQYLYSSLAKIGFNIYTDFFQDIDLIIPIPVHWLTKFLRGFNQSSLLSEELANLSKITLKKNILIKKKYTKKQSEQLYKNRFFNIKDSFLIKNNDIIKNKNILLIDDVVTTGATSNECAKLLKENNAKLVRLFTISKTVLTENNDNY